MKTKIIPNANYRLLLAAVTTLLLAASASAQRLERPAHRANFHSNLAEHEGPGLGLRWKLLEIPQYFDVRFAGSGAYDSSTNSLLVFAGAGLVNGRAVANDVWALSNANGIG